MQVLPGTTWDYLRVHLVKTVLGHIPLVASGTHNTSVQLRLPFHTPECYQGTAIPILHYVILQNAVQLSRCPAPSGICLVWEPQLILHVVGNPLCKFGGQPLESGVVLAVGVLKPDLRRLLLGHVPDRGRFIVIPGSCSSRHPPWLQKVQIKLHTAAQVAIGALHKCQSIKISHWQNGITQDNMV